MSVAECLNLTFSAPLSTVLTRDSRCWRRLVAGARLSAVLLASELGLAGR